MSAESADVREIALDADGVPLSALLARPQGVPPRAVVVAVHGGGMRAGYFHGQAHPDLSLLDLGARLGYTVLAVDRPGYGLSASHLPEGQTVAEQAATLHAALAGFTRDHEVGGGFFLVAHSYGGKVALRAAADDPGTGLIGLDISGCGHRYAVDVRQSARLQERGLRLLNWGPLGLYPPETFRLARSMLAPRPAREVWEASEWQAAFPEVAARVRVPVRFTFAEHESWWRHDDETVAEMTGLLASPRVVVDRHPRAGHNISLGRTARSYHLRALAFLEECLPERGADGADSPGTERCAAVS